MIPFESHHKADCKQYMIPRSAHGSGRLRGWLFPGCFSWRFGGWLSNGRCNPLGCLLAVHDSQNCTQNAEDGYEDGECNPLHKHHEKTLTTNQGYHQNRFVCAKHAPDKISHNSPGGGCIEPSGYGSLHTQANLSLAMVDIAWLP